MQKNRKSLFMFLVFVVAALGIASAQAAAPTTLISASDATNTQNAWLTAAVVGVPAILGIFGVRAAADFIMNRLKKVAR